MKTPRKTPKETLNIKMSTGGGPSFYIELARGEGRPLPPVS